MEYTLEYIKQNWLVDGAIPYSENQVIEAFNEVQSTLGDDWLSSIKFKNGYELSGVYPTLIVVLLGLKLKTIKKGINHQSLITKLKSKDSQVVEKGLSELDAIYSICKNEDDIELELEPKVLRQGKNTSFPDFRVKRKGDALWTYFEVKEPDISNHNKAAISVMRKVQSLFTHIYEFFTLEIVLLHLPTESEIELIFDACLNLVKNPNESEQALPELGLIKMNFGNPNNFELKTYEGFEDKTMFGMASKYQTQNGVGLVAVRIVATDERALKFYDDGSDQLDEQSPGIIFINGRHVPGILKVWPQILIEQLKQVPELKKVVSGFIISKGGIENVNGLEDEIYETKTIINHNANNKAPSWIFEKFEKNKL
jgi:hypothetical protein